MAPNLHAAFRNGRACAFCDKAWRRLRQKGAGMADLEATVEIDEWVIWNGSMGILDMVTIGRVEHRDGGRHGFLAAPYDIVGPFSMEELENLGRIAFGACLVMSRLRWQEDQVELRAEAMKARRALMMQADPEEDRAHRETLDLPLSGVLEVSEINAAFRRKAKTAHPDAGGSDTLYRRIAEARDALLELLARLS